MSTKNKEQLSKIEKKQWKSWLSGENKNYILGIRQAVKRLHEESVEQKGELPFYTPHGPTHCQAVEDLIHRLIPNESYLQLYEKERFFLLASAWLHDLGMEKTVARDVWQKHLDPLEIRKRHHITSARYITSQNKRCGVEEQDKEFLSQLCRFHRKQENLANCPEELIVGQKPYRLRMLAAYLRLADALHVDHSRTPASSYAVCLTYDIPTESKLHWIKSKLVSGINIIPDKHVIKIEFKIPCTAKQKLDFDVDRLNKNIDNIISSVLDDIRTELSSVINVLTRTAPTHYLDIEEVRAEVFLTDQTMNELLELTMNLDIVGEPSASKLVEMILKTATNIAGSYLIKGKKPEKIKGFLEYRPDENTIKEKIDEFITKTSDDLLKRRPCHIGLKKLLDHCQDSIKNTEDSIDKSLNKHQESTKTEEDSNPIKKLVDLMDDLFQRNHNNLIEIRKNATEFFKEEPGLIDKVKVSHSKEKEVEVEVEVGVNVLLYGYSETVIEALCGFRDALICEYVGSHFDFKEYHGSKIEDKISNRFRIFICEGQPKTQTAYGDKLIYHDGIEYSKALKKRRFKNIIILPDIVVSNVIKNRGIHYFLVGANGFTNKVFKHSAGHESIVNIINYQRKVQKEQNRVLPKIVLVASSEKYGSSADSEKNKCEESKCEESKHSVDGFTYWKSSKNESVRSHVWISRDKAIYKEIHDNEHIMFYNPKEDNVPIEELDWIISDKTFHKISSDNPKDLEENIEKFVEQMKPRHKSGGDPALP